MIRSEGLAEAVRKRREGLGDGSFERFVFRGWSWIASTRMCYCVEHVEVEVASAGKHVVLAFRPSDLLTRAGMLQQHARFFHTRFS
jgi:hypothetical protein